VLNVKDLVVELGNFRLYIDDLNVGQNEYFVVLGPNGAGKTVLLETIGGLNKVKKGHIFLEGKDITRVPPEEREIGYVPQDSVLFPFLNVRENVEFALKVRKYPKEKIKERVDFLSKALEIGHLLHRSVKELSGGEKQKVAIARALAPYPKLLLLDEPLGSIDISASKLLRLELRRFHRELKLTTIHVTHNLLEAEELAQRLAMINEGRIEQIGTVEEIMFFPKNEIVSQFVGSVNILDVQSVKSLGCGLFEARCGGITLVIPYEKNNIKKIALSSRDVYVSTDKPPGPEVNRFIGKIIHAEEKPPFVHMRVSVGENILKVDLPKETFYELGLYSRKDVFLIFKLRRLKIYGGEG
jgi:ABC-type sugar transport system ATPase subunit